MDQQTKTFIFLGATFAFALLLTAALTFAGKVGGDLFGQVVIAVVSAVAGLLAPSPLSVGKPPTS